MLNTLHCAGNMNNTQQTIIKQKVMPILQYKIIKTGTQYKKYCDILESLLSTNKKTKAVQDETELLTLLIEKYDTEHNTFSDADPVELLNGLLKEHKMKAVDLAHLLDVSEGLVSDILSYKKGLSKNTIRILSEKFKLNQEAFNRPYKLRLPIRRKLKITGRVKAGKKPVTV